MNTIDSQVLESIAAQKQRTMLRRRKKLFIALGAVVAKAAIGYGAYEWFYASHFVSTDNAYTAAETAQVTPSVGGIVRDVMVRDTQHVKRGDVLVVLDDIDARLALDQAEAEYSRALRRVRGYVANDTTLGAQVDARAYDITRNEAQLNAAKADFERAKIDLDRREALLASGSISGEELTKARNAFATAKANLSAAIAAADQSHANYTAAMGARESNAALIEGTDEKSNPEVVLAYARRDQAQVNLERTVIRSPVDGVVARRNVQIGQQVQPGAALLSVVPINEMHVDANFKEVQLDHVQLGQSVEVVSDLYGNSVKYHGVVSGLAGGTGSVFATIPAQNATGNWIKVVQRVPVRIQLNADELAARPLQMGLSMHVTIDTRDREKAESKSDNNAHRAAATQTISERGFERDVADTHTQF